ncbi:MAG: hypothetical protein NZ839_03620, partial [Endomicrobia bacterium]|nr:hypothetical protein [Endomicrobiia bacterium]
DVQIGIRSNNIQAGNETSKVRISDCGVLLNNEWQEVSIPLSLFKSLESRLDFTQIVVYFNSAVTGDISGTGSGTFWIDNVIWISPGAIAADPDKIYQGLKIKQHSTTGLVRSFENINRAVTYDQALAAITYTYYADFQNAKRIFDAYKNNIGWTGVGGYAEEYNVTNYSVIKSSRTTGPNLWMLLALMYYKHFTGSTEYDVMISSLANWLSSRQDTDGGLKYGYDGANWLDWKSTEHNLTAYAVFQNYARMFNNNDYFTKANNIKNWLNNMWISNEKRFRVGNTVPQIDKALDCYSLAICAFPAGDYNECINGVNGQGVDYYFKCTQTSQLTGKQVTGYDFGGNSGSNPDKDAVWLEGTAQMAVAYWIMGLISSHTYFIDQIEKAVVPMGETAQGIPYATNNGTAYGGWRMDAVNPCISSICWYLFAKNKFNPFYPFSKFDISIHRRIDNVQVSSITWSNVVLPTRWVVADQYIKIDFNPNIKRSWGIQIYTDNFASDADPRFTGSTITVNCAGLIWTENTARQPLPLCWRLTDNTTNTLTIMEAVAQNGSIYLYSPQLGSEYKCFLWMKDRSTPDIPSQNTQKFVDGEDYVTIWDPRGCQHAEGTWANMETPNYLYIGAKFENALTRTNPPVIFRTGKLVMEFFLE